MTVIAPPEAPSPTPVEEPLDADAASSRWSVNDTQQQGYSDDFQMQDSTTGMFDLLDYEPIQQHGNTLNPNDLDRSGASMSREASLNFGLSNESE